MISRNMMIGAILLLSLLLGTTQAFDQFYPFEVATGEIKTPLENLGAPWFQDDALLTFGTGKDATISYDDSQDKLYFNNTPIYLEEAVTAPGGITGSITGTASRIAVGSFIDTSYGLKNSTSNKAQINLSSTSGMAFGTGASLGALGLKTGLLKHTLKDGTAAATNVSVTGMATGDELISVFSYTSKSSIASVADRTAEYAIGASWLVKSAGTNETGNQLDIWYMDRTA